MYGTAQTGPDPARYKSALGLRPGLDLADMWRSSSAPWLDLQENTVKTPLMACACAALLFNLIGPVLAQDQPGRAAPEASAQPMKLDSAKVPLGQRGNPQDQHRQMDRPGSHEVDSASSKGPDANQTHDLYKGSRLPAEYYNKPQYVVEEWRSHRVSAPPQGHYWVQAGYAYVLVASTTGMIVKIMVVT